MGIFANKQVKKAAISPMPLTAQADAPKVQAAVGIGGANSVGQFYQYQEGTARNRAMSLATVSRSRDLLASVIACMPLQMYNEVFNDSTGEMEQVDIAPRSWLRQPDPTVTYNFLMAWTLSLHRSRAYLPAVSPPPIRPTAQYSLALAKRFTLPANKYPPKI
jgi:hypothetical protein